MVPEIKDLKTWEEAESWLARHGYGLAQIALIKAEWKAPEAAKPVVAPKVVEAPKPKEEPVASVKK